MSSALSSELRTQFREYLEEGLSGRAAAALASATGVVAHAPSIGRFLRKLGYTYKKSHWSRPNGCARVKHLRQDWFKYRIPKMQAHPDRLVFIDETAVKTNLTRLRGRNLRGKRLEMTTPFGAWPLTGMVFCMTSIGRPRSCGFNAMRSWQEIGGLRSHTSQFEKPLFFNGIIGFE